MKTLTTIYNVTIISAANGMAKATGNAEYNIRYSAKKANEVEALIGKSGTLSGVAYEGFTQFSGFTIN